MVKLKTFTLSVASVLGMSIPLFSIASSNVNIMMMNNVLPGNSLTFANNIKNPTYQVNSVGVLVKGPKSPDRDSTATTFADSVVLPFIKNLYSQPSQWAGHLYYLADSDKNDIATWPGFDANNPSKVFVADMQAINAELIKKGIPQSEVFQGIIFEKEGSGEVFNTTDTAASLKSIRANLQSNEQLGLIAGFNNISDQSILAQVDHLYVEAYNLYKIHAGKMYVDGNQQSITTKDTFVPLAGETIYSNYTVDNSAMQLANIFDWDAVAQPSAKVTILFSYENDGPGRLYLGTHDPLIPGGFWTFDNYTALINKLRQDNSTLGTASFGVWQAQSAFSAWAKP